MLKNLLGRRGFVKGALGFAALGGAARGAAAPRAAAPPASPAGKSPLELARHEEYWVSVRGQYDLPSAVVQLENGNWGVMAKPVLQSYQHQTLRVNRDSSYFSRRLFGREWLQIREQVAATLGAQADEIAFTRGATEALQNLISGYRRLSPGDAVMYADTDYDSMQTVMDWLPERRGVRTLKITLPERATQAALLAVYEQALKDNPDVRLLLLTHLSHRHGLILPVADIVAMAREYGVDCIVDAAHSWGQMDFDVEQLGADFVGFNLHKWMGAPLGVGVMYIRRGCVDAIEPYLGETVVTGKEILARVHTGTFNYAALLAVPDALAFHRHLGGANKAARLAHLRDYWVHRVSDVSAVETLTLDGPEDRAGITAFRLRGMRASKQNKELARQLLEEHGVFTVHRDGLAGGSCVRVTPGLFTSTDDLDQLLAAIRSIAGVPA